MGDQVWLMTSKQTLPLLGIVSSHLRRLHSQLVNVRVEDLVHEANTGRLVGELLWQIDVNLPYTLGEWRCSVSA